MDNPMVENNEKSALLTTPPNSATKDQAQLHQFTTNADTSPPTQCDLENGGRGGQAFPQFRIVLAPGLEFDATRRYRYGLHALFAALLLFISFIVVEMRNCRGPGLQLKRLQGLHGALCLGSLAIYMLSLFSVAQLSISRGYKWLYWVTLSFLLIMCGLIIWTDVEATVNPCIRSFSVVPIDLDSIFRKANVFNRNDVVGLIVLGLDVIATFFLLSSAHNFFQYRNQ